MLDHLAETVLDRFLHREATLFLSLSHDRLWKEVTMHSPNSGGGGLCFPISQFCHLYLFIQLFIISRDSWIFILYLGLQFSATLSRVL